MKKIKLLLSIVLAVVTLQNCGSDKKDNNLLLAGLALAASSNCFSVPAQAAVADGNSSSVKTFNCTVTVNDGIFTYTYDSRGWATKVDMGFGNPTTVTYSGTLEICQ